MKKEFINPTIRFSFFSRENIVTESNVDMAMDAFEGIKGTGVTVNVTNVKMSELKQNEALK